MTPSNPCLNCGEGHVTEATDMREYVYGLTTFKIPLKRWDCDACTSRYSDHRQFMEHKALRLKIKHTPDTDSGTGNDNASKTHQNAL